MTTVECLRCRTIVETRHEHDASTCRCRAIEVRGQDVEVRVGWVVLNIEDWYREVRR